MHFNQMRRNTTPREHDADILILKRVLSLAVIVILCIILLHLSTQTAEGVAWRYEGRITTTEYRDIALTDLDGDGNYEIGGILKEPEGGDPSAEFHTYDSGSWDPFPEDISYKGIYNDLALIGPYVAAGHSGGNSADSWFYNDGTGQFEFNEPDPGSPTENYSLCIDIGDLNNDTFPDIIAGYKTNGIKVFYGDGTGQYTMGEFPKDSDMVKAILIAELNNGAHPDIVSTHKVWGGSGSDLKKIEVWMGDGEGNWSKKTVIQETSIDYSALAAADLDNDGHLDIIAASDSKLGIDKYIYQPAGSFWDRGSVNSKGSYSSLQLLDVDRDGEEDVIGCRFDGEGINIYMGTGTGSFESEDVGPVQNGNVWACVIWDFNGDGHEDLVAANMSGTFYWEQALPEIKNVMIPATMLAQREYYILSMEVSSEALDENPYNLLDVKIRFFDNDTTVFTLTYDGNTDTFYVEDGTSYVTLDTDNCNRTPPLPDPPQGKTYINFSMMLKWAVPDLPRGEGPMIKAYMRDRLGSTGWLDVDPGDVRIVSSVEPQELAVGDGNDTVNPGDTIPFSGALRYSGTDIPIPDKDIDSVVIHADGLDPVTAYDIVNGTFSVNLTIPAAGEFHLWPEVVMDLGGPQPESLLFPKMNLTVLSDFIMVTHMWITGDLYNDSSSRTSWQSVGSNMTFHTHALYNHSGLPYEGELKLTNGAVVLNTTNMSLNYTSHLQSLVEMQFYPLNNSGFNNSYGSMLVNDVALIPRAIWDGESPVIQDFTAQSLMNGSVIKAVDALVEIIVTEHGIFEPNRGYGEIMINWTIIRNENTTINGSAIRDEITTINGSALMNMTGYQENNYTFSYYLPLSQAKTDDIVKFWFLGNDTVGNEIVSYLWPARCTEEDPATVLVDPIPPSPPLGLYTNIGDGYIEVRWLPNTEDDLAGYRVYRSTDGENFSKSPVSGLDLVRYNYFLDRGLENGKKYYYRVTAVDRAVIPNESNFSEITSGVPEEDEGDLIEELLGILRDHILFVFIGIGALIIVGGSVGIMQRNRDSDGPSKDDDHDTAGKTGPIPPAASISSPTSPTPSISTPLTTSAAPSTLPSSTPAQPTTPQQPFPPINWTCPSCSQHLTLQQGERFCTGCGYKIR